MMLPLTILVVSFIGYAYVNDYEILKTMLMFIIGFFGIAIFAISFAVGLDKYSEKEKID